MPYYYQIKAQFSCPDAPTFNEIQNTIEAAVSYYNNKSLLARNKKQIIDFHIMAETLTLTLESSVELPYPSKSLRVFCSYLIDEKNPDNLRNFIYGKQLFKMRSTTLNELALQELPELNDDLNKKKLLLIQKILSADTELIDNIISFLGGE